MSPEQFAYWLQGFAELQQEPPSAEQWKSIKEHLSTVFFKVTPPIVWPAAPHYNPAPEWAEPGKVIC